MRLYLDTSALVKLFIDEAGSDQVFDAVERSSARFTHLLSYAEACAAFARMAREGKRSGWFDELRSELDRAWPKLDVVMPDEAMIRRAGSLAHAYSLRGFDSVHLAAAEAAQGRGSLTFACFDQRLNAAAARLDLRTFE